MQLAHSQKIGDFFQFYSTSCGLQPVAAVAAQILTSKDLMSQSAFFANVYVHLPRPDFTILLTTHYSQLFITDMHVVVVILTFYYYVCMHAYIMLRYHQEIYSPLQINSIN